MKKFLIAVIFLIPVVVVFTLTATGTLIRNASPVNARGLSIRDDRNIEVTEDTVINVNLEQDASPVNERFIIIELLPTISAQEIIYELDDSIPDSGKLELEKVPDKEKYYRIIPLEGGICRVIVRAKNNRNVFKTVNVYVKENSLKNIIVYNEEGEVVRNEKEDISKEIRLTKPQRLFLDILPVAAVQAGGIKWESSNEAVVTVNENGTLFPVYNGNATVRVSLTDILGNRLSTEIKVSTVDALVKQHKFYTNDIINSEWVRQNAVISAVESIDSLGEGVFVIKGTGGSQETITVLPLNNENDWKLSEIRPVFFLNDTVTLLNPVFLSEERRNEKFFPEFISNDPSILRIDGSRIVPVSRGKATIRGEYEGIVKEYEIEVKGKPLFFNLNLNSEDGKLGIKMDRLWARKFFEGENFVTTYQFGARLRAEEADILWETDNSQWAEIDENALITFKEGSLGKAVKVTATVMAGNYRTTVKREFTFKIHTDDNAVNAFSVEAAYKIAEAHKGTVTILQNNISLSKTWRVTSSVYGNGFLIEASKWSDVSKYTRLVELTKGTTEDANLETIMLEDFVIESGFGKDEASNRGDGLFLEDTVKPVTIKNAIIRHVNNSVVLRNTGDVLVEGCILGDSGLTGLMGMFNPEFTSSTITLRNNIMRDSIGPSLMHMGAGYIDRLTNQNVLPNYVIEGFYDVYNWKSAAEMKNMLKGVDIEGLQAVKEFGIDPDQILSVVNDTFHSIFLRSDMEYLAYVDPVKKDRYFSIGAFFVGVFYKLENNKITLKDEGLRLVDFKLPTSGTEGTLIGILELAFKTQKMTILNPSYVLTYQKEEGKTRNKPGDPIPESKELFERLNSYYAENTESEESFTD